jgi:TetR/AcrR family transcriptional repressor of nem operon
MSRVPRTDEILDAAERLAWRAGYHAFSFRDLARTLGLSSASLHYHFATKEDLAVALVRRTAKRFVERMGQPGDPGTPPDTLMKRFLTLFRENASKDHHSCIFIVYVAEMDLLPDRLQSELLQLHLLVVGWLTALLDRFPSGKAALPLRTADRARAIIAALEGALLAVRVESNFKELERVIKVLQVTGVIPSRASRRVGSPRPARKQAMSAATRKRGKR